MFDGAVTGMTLRRIRPEMYNWWNGLRQVFMQQENKVLPFFRRCAELSSICKAVVTSNSLPASVFCRFKRKVPADQTFFKRVGRGWPVLHG